MGRGHGACSYCEGHQILALGLVERTYVACRVLPSKKERVCFTTWMSVLRPGTKPASLSRLHHLYKTGDALHCLEICLLLCLSCSHQ